MTQEQVSQVYEWWSVFKPENKLTEIRIIGSRVTYSGYYRNVENLLRDLAVYEKEGAVYFVVNTINDGCYDKTQKEQMLSQARLSTTNDREIQGYDFIFLDIDCERPTDTNSTDEEKAYAYKKTQDIFRFLRNEGFNDCLINDSANGYHIYIPVRLQNTPENQALVKKFTMAMAMMFSDAKVHIDQVVANPSRIAKLPGTYSNKGSAKSKERPRRMARLMYYPSEIKPNDISYIRKIASLYPEAEKPSWENNYSRERFDLDAFISKHGIQVREVKEVADGRRYILDHCLFDSNHKGKDAVLFQANNGAIGYYCFHNSCSMHKWADVRKMFEPDAYEKRYDRQSFRAINKWELPPAEPQAETEEKGAKWIKMSSVEKAKIDPVDYIPSGIPQIDSLIVGFKRRQISLWSGYRGSAKSTILNELILNAANAGYKSALWTGELDDKDVKRWLYLQAAGKAYNTKSNYNNKYFTPDKISDKIDPWIDKYFLLYNQEYTANFRTLAEEIKEVVEKEGVDMVFLDNLTILDYDDLASQNEYKAQKLLVTQLTNLAKRLNIHIHVVAHPNKSGGFLRMNSISGSGHIPDLAQNVFILHRINRDFERAADEFLSKETKAEIILSGCTNCIEICKCRDSGFAVETFIKLFFEMESNRLKNEVSENIHYGWEDYGEQMKIEAPKAETPSMNYEPEDETEFVPRTEQYNPFEATETESWEEDLPDSVYDPFSA